MLFLKNSELFGMIASSISMALTYGIKIIILNIFSLYYRRSDFILNTLCEEYTYGILHDKIAYLKSNFLIHMKVSSDSLPAEPIVRQYSTLCLN